MNYGETESPLKNVTTSTLSGAGQGAITGASIGGAPGAIIGGVIGGVSGYLSGKANEELEEQQRIAQEEFNQKLDAFVNSEVNNPFANISNTFAGLTNPLEEISTENKFEDLTVNLKSADYQRQMAEESQAAILQTARAGAGGAGGIASISALLAKQNAQVRQQIAADIGAQEAQNQRLKAQGAESARQVEIQQAQAEMNRQQAVAQGAMQAQLAQAEGQFKIDQVQRDKEMLALGYDAQTLAGDTAALQAQMEANTQSVNNLFGTATDLYSAYQGGGGTGNMFSGT